MSHVEPTQKALCEFLGKTFAGSVTGKLGQDSKGEKTMGFELLILSHFSCVTMKQLLNCCEPQFSLLQNGDNFYND